MIPTFLFNFPTIVAIIGRLLVLLEVNDGKDKELDGKIAEIMMSSQ